MTSNDFTWPQMTFYYSMKLTWLSMDHNDLNETFSGTIKWSLSDPKWPLSNVTWPKMTLSEDKSVESFFLKYLACMHGIWFSCSKIQERIFCMFGLFPTDTAAFMDNRNEWLMDMTYNYDSYRVSLQVEPFWHHYFLRT